MIRKIKKEDVSTIYTLGQKYKDNFRLTYNLESYIDNNIYIMLCEEENNVIKGFIIATIIDDTVEILLVYVDTLYRRQNIATNLLNNVNKMGKDSFLEVSTENNSAYNLYIKNGYKEVSRRKGYYNGVDAIVMKKVI